MTDLFCISKRPAMKTRLPWGVPRSRAAGARRGRRHRPLPTGPGRCLVWLAAVAATGCMSANRISDADVQTLEVNPLIQMLGDSKYTTVLVDVRQPVAFAEGHIPGAINIPLNQLRSADPRLAEARQIVVYSERLNDMLARAAAKTLLRQGYKHVHCFTGGLALWRQGNKQVTGSTSE